MIRHRGPGAASSSAVAAEAAGSRSSAETPARAPEKQNHSAGLERGAAGRRGRLGRRDRRREGAGEGDQATAGREPSRRPRPPSPGFRLGAEGPAAREARGAQPGGRRGGGARRSRPRKLRDGGPDAAARPRPEKGFRQLQRSKRVRRGSSGAVQPSPHPVPPLPPLHPFPSDHTLDPHSPIPTPSWLSTLRTARPASPSKKIETIDARENYIYT